MARKRPVTKLVLSLVMFLGVAAQAATPAQADVTMGIAPVRLELAATPGAIGEPEITVSNFGSDAFNVQADIESYGATEAAVSAEDWIRLDPTTFSLEPNSQQIVKLRMAVPFDVPTGGYYARVSFTTAPDETPVEGGALVTVGAIRVGVLITVQGNGELIVDAAIERFVPVLEADGRVGFRVMMHNDGNIHVFPTGLVEISQDDGSTIATLEIPTATPLLPGNQALLTSHGSLPLELGADFDASVSLDIGTDEPVTAEAAFQVEAAAEFTGMSVCENLDRGPTLEVDMRNLGSLGLVPGLLMTVKQANGVIVNMAAPSEPLLLLPTEELTFATDFPDRLVTGDYMLEVQLQYGTEPSIVEELPFAIGGTGPTTVPVCPPVSE